MKYSVHYVLLSVALLFLLSGCNRVIDWGESNFNQGTDVENLAAKAKKYVKSVTVYDEFTTVGMFDALWLSDEVRTIYADLHALRQGKKDEYKKTFLRRQLEENNHFITFLVLSPFEFPLADSQAKWSMFLQVKDARYFPIEVAVIELDQEYKAIFGKKISRFKESYIVKFDAKTLDEEEVLTADINKLELRFRSLKKDTQLVWNTYQTNSNIVVYQNNNNDVQVSGTTGKECA